MRENTLKQKLQAGKAVFGTMITFPSPPVVEMLGYLGFDWVLLDTPPVGLLPDAQLLARLTQAVVFVIGAGSTPFPVVEKAIAELGRECIIGTVLTGLEERSIPANAYHH